MNKGGRGLVAFVFLFVLLLASPGRGDTPNPNMGLEIMKKARGLYGGEDQRSTVTLRLINKGGDERRIVTQRFWKSYGGKDGFDSKTLFFTEYPPDAKGVGFLIWDYSEPGRPDGLWLYLPTLRTTRPLSTRDQNDAFMGSDLTFGDMGQRRLDEDQHVLVKEETLQGVSCYVVESTPKEAGGIYSKKLVWVSKADSTILKIDYYDVKKELLKTQALEWQRVGKALVFKKMEVTNVQTQHKTIYEISDLKIDSGLRDEDFTERVLKTGLRR